MYLSWYGFGRFFIEALRTDSLYIPGTELRISQVVGMACFVIFGALLVWGLIYSKKFNDADAKLNKIDVAIKPSLVTPAFCAKKVTAVADGETTENVEESIPDSSEGDENGTDN